MPLATMLRVIIADDHRIVRQGLKQILLEEFSPIHIEEAEDATDLLQKVLSQPWDIVISDLVMPGGGVFEALKAIKEAKPKLPVFIISTYSAEQYLSRVIKAGAEGFISKDSLPNGLIIAIQQIIEKGTTTY
jgi:DNA-binding NarL/FixJ family response regulator